MQFLDRGRSHRPRQRYTEAPDRLGRPLGDCKAQASIMKERTARENRDVRGDGAAIHAQKVEATTGIEPVYAVLQTAP